MACGYIIPYYSMVCGRIQCQVAMSLCIFHCTLYLNEYEHGALILQHKAMCYVTDLNRTVACGRRLWSSGSEPELPIKSPKTSSCLWQSHITAGICT
jgi:hypothetical protein